MVAPIRLRSDDLICRVQVVMESEHSWPGGSPGTILDAEANCGYAAVEPEPENLEALRRTLATNGLEATVFGAALTAVEGPVDLQLSAVSGAHSVVPGLRSGGPGVVTVDGRGGGGEAVVSGELRMARLFVAWRG